MSLANWMNDLKIYCIFCGLPLSMEKPSTIKGNLMHCPSKYRRPEHPEDQEVWVWTDLRVINYRIDSVQLSYDMIDSKRVKSVKYFNLRNNALPVTDIVIAKDFDMDFSLIKTVEDFKEHLQLLRAFG